MAPASGNEASIVLKNGKEPVALQSITELLEILSAPGEMFGDLLNKDPIAPIGFTDDGFPRPLNAGLWYHVETNFTQPALPQAFRKLPVQSVQYDESNLTSNFARTRSVSAGRLETLVSLYEANLPSRLLKWHESPLAALYEVIATCSDSETIDDMALYILNAYRLNQHNSITLTYQEMPGAEDLDTLVRVFQATTLYLEDAIQLAFHAPNLITDQRTLSAIEEISEKLRGKDVNLMRQLHAPIACRSRLDCWTLHGGKINHFEHAPDPQAKNRNLTRARSNRLKGTWTFLGQPHSLAQSSEGLTSTRSISCLKKIKIPKESLPRLKQEMVRLGLPSLLGEDTRRWKIDPLG